MQLKYKPSKESLVKLISNIPGEEIGFFSCLLKPILDKKILPENNSSLNLPIPEKFKEALPYLKKIEEIKNKISLWLANGVMPYTRLKYSYFGSAEPSIEIKESNELIDLYEAVGAYTICDRFSYNNSHFWTRGGRFSEIYMDHIKKGKPFEIMRDKVIPEALKNKYEIRYLSVDFGDSHEHSDHYYYHIHFSRSLWADQEEIEIHIDEKMERCKIQVDLKEQVDKEMAKIGAFPTKTL